MSATSGGGVLQRRSGLPGRNVELVGQLPLTERFSVLGRAGVQYSRASHPFPGQPPQRRDQPQPEQLTAGAKFGLGLEYKLSEALAMRAEVSRFRVDDAVGNRGDVDLISLGLSYKFGRPAARAAVAPVEVVPVKRPPRLHLRLLWPRQ